ncbi:Fur family transcriptional regulator [Inconstantimicrobium mannanitabidum]|uniref:Fur family transcriptional regulator n=1 Tax=Inconstantimicrobium mannanitabidum TaxID=1604901 RepID=UPI0021C37F5B|nr:Fur family transcriptional regulator [Clostridium sp. TW13]
MDADSFFRQKNLKVTKARVYIYMLLAKSSESLTAEYIYSKSKEDGIDINLSTVYRTLEIFEKKHIIEKFNIGENSHLYSLIKEQHKHVLQCSLCHKEIEVPCPMKQIEELVKNQTGFTLTEHTLKLKGICEKCSKKKE